MIVCVCHGVSHRTILEAVASGASDLEALGRACGAGTDCGSCIPELVELTHAARAGKIRCTPPPASCSGVGDGLSRPSAEADVRRMAAKRTA